ncbi:MAG: PilZ domain-containing protein [Xanthomonadales bacterium]|nr:PilZ domain-containing protein [Xanthomonadales bacterium]MCB1641225.1 PilZ domain-containing protein [Xanthomonadales bacterium]
MSESGSEKRRHPRIGLSAAAVLVALPDQGYLTTVEDVSAGGARLGRPAIWPEGVARKAILYFIFDQDTVIALRASIVREGQDHLAFLFEDGQHERVEDLLYESRFLVHARVS